MAKGKTHLNQLLKSLSPDTYPWRMFNAPELLINGEVFFRHMLDSIDSAKHEILLEMYLVESGKVATQFIDAFIAAADRGAKVHILLDDFGCRGLKADDRARLEHSNISLAFYNPLHYGEFRRNLFRDHRKLLVVDREIAYVGGVGLTDDFASNGKRSLGWRETVVAIKGECVVDWVDAFARVWTFYARKRFESNVIPPSYESAEVPGRVNCNLGTVRQGVKRSLLKRIRSSERRCWIATAYFVPSFKVRRALSRAAERGVDVRVLLPGPKTDHPAVRHAARRFYFSLLKRGVKIYEYQPRFMHQKIILCDSWVSIGSSNIDRWNFRWNLEANQEIEEQVFVSKVEEMLEIDFRESEECEFSRWQKRSTYSRFMEYFWGTIDRLLDKYLR